MKVKSYLVIRAHVSEFPEPITFQKGAALMVGDQYEGPEGWEDWLFCELLTQEAGDSEDDSRDHSGGGSGGGSGGNSGGGSEGGFRGFRGWVPAQIIERIEGNVGRAREDYTARELNVQVGDVLRGIRTLNGWVWCEHNARSESGWVPLANLQEIGHEA